MAQHFLGSGSSEGVGCVNSVTADCRKSCRPADGVSPRAWAKFCAVKEHNRQELERTSESG